MLYISDAVDSHAQVAKRSKQADVIRDLRSPACSANVSSNGNRCILPIVPSNSSIHNLRKSHCSSFQSPPPKRSALIFKPGPRSASRIASFRDEAVYPINIRAAAFFLMYHPVTVQSLLAGLVLGTDGLQGWHPVVTSPSFARNAARL